MGLEAAGWRVAFANDIDSTKRDQYDAHFGDADSHFVLGDVHALDPSQIGTVDLATASFPCTDLSVAGGRRGIRHGESSAFWGFVNAMEGLGRKRPPLILLENVVGFLSSHAGADFRDAMLALNELGYGVDVFVLDAKWFVPQSRPRLFVVGKLKSSASADVAASRLRPQAVIDAIRNNPDINWALQTLPEPPAGTTLQVRDILDAPEVSRSQWWSKERTEYLLAQMSPRHLEWVKQHCTKKIWSCATAFRRVRLQPDGTKRSMAEIRTDGIAGCLRTPKGGSGRQILVMAGFGTVKARLLSAQECARLMGADDFNVTGSLNDALFGFGDAVCVPVIRWIAMNYLNQVANAKRRSSTTAQR